MPNSSSHCETNMREKKEFKSVNSIVAHVLELKVLADRTKPSRNVSISHCAFSVRLFIIRADSSVRSKRRCTYDRANTMSHYPNARAHTLRTTD